jgi:signal transduction histidine kinase
VGLTGTEAYTFKARARLLELLGEQLIKDSNIAVFELVKNAYDADATECIVTMYDIEYPDLAKIVIEDSGSGMDLDTIQNVWLEVGTDYRSKQFQQLEPTPMFKRIPMGAKGIGRFAVHKLGNAIRLITRKVGNPEVIVDIDWSEISGRQYLEDIRIDITESEDSNPLKFTAGTSGTYIEIKKLKDVWTRGKVRELHRNLISISSPFAAPTNFQTLLNLVPNNGWLDNLLDVSDILSYSLFHAKCFIVGETLEYEYEFTPNKKLQKLDLEHRSHHKKIKMQTRVQGNSVPINLEYSVDGKPFAIGRVEFELYIFDRDVKVLDLFVNDKKGFKEFLDDNGGIRVYRDGIRIYDYGDKGNDWLSLGGRRINQPVERISNNIILGAVSINASKSQDLVEKTNREGFIENEALQTLRLALDFAITQIETERNRDKAELNEKLMRTPSSKKNKVREPVLEELDKVAEKVEESVESDSVKAEIKYHIETAKEQFYDVQDVLLTAAGSGLTLSSIIHEVERGIAELDRAISKKADYEHLKRLSQHLSELVEGFSYLIRRSGMKTEKVSELIKHAIQNTKYRAEHHNVKIISNVETSELKIKCSRRLIISILMNLIDNSIWWLDTKEDQNEQKELYIASCSDFRGHPAIIIADNGPGFIDPPEYLIQPFITRKPSSMGLGLHIAYQVMKHHNGNLEFLTADEIDLPITSPGAILALVFEEEG